MRPKVVVMMSTYNGEKYIAEQVKSISSQEINADLTLLVRDDGSKDNTLLILHKFESKVNIKYIEDDLSLGAAKSFWKLLMNAPEADYYAFVDQDDIWDKNKLAIAVQTIGHSNNCVLWTSNCRLISGDGKVIKENNHKFTPYFDIPSQLICGSIQGCAMVMNQAALNYLRTIDIKKIPMHDLVTMEYIIANGKVLYEPKPLFSYRIHSNNLVAKDGKNLVKRLKGTANLWIKNRYEVSNFAKQIKHDLEYCLDSDVVKYLEELGNCKKSMKSRIFILRSPLTRTRNLAGLRSYIIRVILGIV